MAFAEMGDDVFVLCIFCNESFIYRLRGQNYKTYVREFPYVSCYVILHPAP